MSDRPVVLWVEDDPLHMMATSWLQDAGFELVTASTFVEGRERILNESRLDLAILDVHVRLATQGGRLPSEMDFALTKGAWNPGLCSLGSFSLKDPICLSLGSRACLKRMRGSGFKSMELASWRRRKSGTRTGL
jgi:hypothetical protein